MSIGLQEFVDVVLVFLWPGVVTCSKRASPETDCRDVRECGAADASPMPTRVSQPPHNNRNRRPPRTRHGTGRRDATDTPRAARRGAARRSPRVPPSARTDIGHVVPDKDVGHDSCESCAVRHVGWWWWCPLAARRVAFRSGRAGDSEGQGGADVRWGAKPFPHMSVHLLS